MFSYQWTHILVVSTVVAAAVAWPGAAHAVVERGQVIETCPDVPDRPRSYAFLPGRTAREGQTLKLSFWDEATEEFMVLGLLFDDEAAAVAATRDPQPYVLRAIVVLNRRGALPALVGPPETAYPAIQCFSQAVLKAFGDLPLREQPARLGIDEFRSPYMPADGASPTMLEALQRFQTAIVGVVGFAGVIMTLVVNAWIARRRDEALRTHEKDTLVRALSAELRAYRRVMVASRTENSSMVSPADGELLIPANSVLPVFDANVGRLGLLDGSQVGPVLDAYTTLREFDRRLVLFSNPSQSGLYRGVSTDGKAAVEQLLASMVPKLDRAIAALEGSGGNAH